MKTHVLVTCHGTVDREDDVPAFLANIRRGRPTPPAIIDEVTRRLRAIGGSPLMRTTREQAKGLEDRLQMPVHVAGRLWHPYPGEVIEPMIAAGAERILSLPLAPQSVHIYHASVREALANHPSIALVEAPAYGNEPLLIDAFVENIDAALASLPDGARAGAVVVLSAHSLPKRIIAMGDPYERDFREMAALVSARVEAKGNPTRIAFQSEGMDGGAWLGPNLHTTFQDVKAGGASAIVVAPIGFLADHVETLYDLDIEAKALAAEVGIQHYARASALNTNAHLLDGLAAVARRALSG